MKSPKQKQIAYLGSFNCIKLRAPSEVQVDVHYGDGPDTSQGCDRA